MGITIPLNKSKTKFKPEHQHSSARDYHSTQFFSKKRDIATKYRFQSCDHCLVTVHCHDEQEYQVRR